MKQVSLSKAAERVLDEIDDYTIEHFGLEQAIRTTERFRETFRELAEMPLSGQLRSELSPGDLVSQETGTHRWWQPSISRGLAGSPPPRTARVPDGS